MAIAFNSDYTHSSTGGASSPTLAYTNPTTPSIVFFAATMPSGETATATNGATSMVEVNHTSSAGGSGNSLYLWALKNPTGGAVTITLNKSGSGSSDYAAWSYTDSSAAGTGVDQQNTFTGTTLITETLTPTLTGMWMIAVNTNSGPDSTANSNCTKRSGASAQRDLGVFDSNGSLTGGIPNAQVQNISGAGEAVACTFDIQNNVVVAAAVRHNLSLMGVGQ